MGLDAGPEWVVLSLAALALLAVPVLRRLLPRGRRHRGGGAVLFLGASLVLSVVADFEQDTAIDEEVRTRIWHAAHGAGLEIPFPIRRVIIAEGAGKPVGETFPAARRLSRTTRAEGGD